MFWKQSKAQVMAEAAINKVVKHIGIFYQHNLQTLIFLFHNINIFVNSLFFQRNE
jgi:hypothetical protein